MEIKYSESKDFEIGDIERLFLSVKWDSGKYPEKLVRALHNSSHVVSAWDNDRLVGLVRALDDGDRCFPALPSRRSGISGIPYRG